MSEIKKKKVKYEVGREGQIRYGLKETETDDSIELDFKLDIAEEPKKKKPKKKKK